MVLGTTSGAGKSLLTTALCRHYARRGLRVAPFKPQNMSNNARVVVGPGGQPGEIGSAQYFQALAARAVPDVRMNPLLLKPESDLRSQVVLLGQVDHGLGSMPWRDRSEVVWPTIATALDELRAEYDVVVMEGAGSPAEVNLQATDVANIRPALHARARCLLVTDIDRGGAFAHLYGTWALLPPPLRSMIDGFVLNKFRGDPTLLDPAPRLLAHHTGVPTVATLPMWREHGLPDEDGVFDDRSMAAGPITLTVAVVAYPRVSNLDEFQVLKTVPGLRLVWARTPADVSAADWIVLPGSKHTVADLGWIRDRGLDLAVIEHARRGRAVLGICAGLQMLGDRVQGSENGARGSVAGLGLLPVTTTYETAKIVRRTNTRLGALAGPWAALSGVEFEGYEIHQGRTQPTRDPGGTPTGPSGEGSWWQSGPVLGLSVHGLFEASSTLRALFGASATPLDAVFDGLADFVTGHFDPGVLDRLVA
ncbi:MAG: cobyric acid synthase [Actinomycetota bacterium]|nr:cobyric acid synthase [Actinomycetota bacterium]